MNLDKLSDISKYFNLLHLNDTFKSLRWNSNCVEWVTGIAHCCTCILTVIVIEYKKWKFLDCICELLSSIGDIVVQVNYLNYNTTIGSPVLLYQISGWYHVDLTMIEQPILKINFPQNKLVESSSKISIPSAPQHNIAAYSLMMHRMDRNERLQCEG